MSAATSLQAVRAMGDKTASARCILLLDAIRGQLQKPALPETFLPWFEPLMEEALTRLSAPTSNTEPTSNMPQKRKIEPQRRFFSKKRKSTAQGKPKMAKPTAVEQMAIRSILKGDEAVPDQNAKDLCSECDHNYCKPP